MPVQKIEISAKTIIFAVLFLLSLRFLWLIQDLIFSLFIAFIIMSALKPFVVWLVKKKIPRVAAAIIIYLVFLGIFFNIVAVIIPPLVGESVALVKNLPSLVKNLSPSLGFLSIDISQYAPDLTNQLLNLVNNIFSNTVFFLTTLFFGFYFLLQENMIKGVVANFFNESQTQKIADIIDKAENRMNAWFWGEMILMTIVGVMTFIGLSLIGIKYSLSLAFLAGLLEVVPNLGPTISAIPPLLLGFSQSYLLGLATLILAFVIQQLENNIVVPIVMKRAVGLNPIITLVALIIGGKLAGVLGVFLAIPTTLFAETILIEVLKLQRNPSKLAVK